MSTKVLGAYGEALASQYLQAQGYRILEANFRCKLGEIDLIAQDGNVICFVEVKTRRSLAYGQPFEAVHSFKIRKLTRLALIYLKYKFQSIEVPCRFDVVSIVCDPKGEARIQHLKNAFDACL